MIINAIVFLIVSVCVAVVLNSWTARRQPVWLTWKIIWFPVKFYLLSFCFTLESKLFAIIIFIMCVSVYLYMINYRFHCYSFNCMIMLASFSIRWSRFFLSISCSISKFNNNKNKSTISLAVFCLWTFIFAQVFIVVCFDGIHVYMLLTINWCVFFSSGTNFNFFSVDFLTMDLHFSTFHLTFHSMI